MKKAIYLLLFVISTASVMAQDSVYARQIIRSLTASQMWGRGASHAGDSIAANFLAGEMSRLGVLPLQVNYLQYYTYSCYSFDGAVALTINGQELDPYNDFKIFPTSRYATPKKLAAATFKKQLKDGTWLIGVDKLDTYGPIVGEYSENPVCIEVLNSVLPRKVKRVDCEVPIQFHPQYRSQNVVGYIPGVVDSMIVLTAHYDHCGTMGDFVLFPGAHDNASGTAAVLDLAKTAAQHKPYYTYVFMLFSGEESGLLGSKYAAEHPLIDFSKVKLLCNLDMFCGGDEGLMVFNANSENTKPYYERLVALNQQSRAALEIRPRNNSANSDHYWFSNYCPAIFLLTMGQPYGGYHDPADKCEACGLNHYQAFMQMISQLVFLD